MIKEIRVSDKEGEEKNDDPEWKIFDIARLGHRLPGSCMILPSILSTRHSCPLFLTPSS